MRQSRRLAILTLAVAALLAPSVVGAQPAPQAANHGAWPAVTANYSAAPLGDILRYLASLAAIDLRLDPAVEGTPVTVSLEAVLLPQALDQVLRSSGVNFAGAGLDRVDRGQIRLVVGAPGRSVPISARPEMPPAKDGPLLVESQAAAAAEPPAPERDPKDKARKEKEDGPGGGIIAVPAPTPEEEIAIREGLEITRKAVEQIPLGVYGPTPKVAPPPGPPGLPFPDANGRPIPIPVPPKPPGDR